MLRYSILAALMVALALIAFAAGIVEGPSTAGDGYIVMACFFGIMGRLAQAQAHHADAQKQRQNEPRLL
jgi:hypothetical protein